MVRSRSGVFAAVVVLAFGTLAAWARAEGPATRPGADSPKAVRDALYPAVIAGDVATVRRLTLADSPDQQAVELMARRMDALRRLAEVARRRMPADAERIGVRQEYERLRAALLDNLGHEIVVTDDTAETKPPTGKGERFVRVDGRWFAGGVEPAQAAQAIDYNRVVVARLGDLIDAIEAGRVGTADQVREFMRAPRAATQPK
jgi:hypothetical protein